MRGSQLQNEKWKAPDWRVSESYGDTLSWSNRRWAWEFLRRNPAYQAINRFEGWPPHLQLQHGQPFGRKKIRAYWRDFDNSEEEPGVWLLDQVDVTHGWDDWGTSKQRELRETEISLTFDLAVLARSGEAGMTSLMNRLRAVVSAQLQEHGDAAKFPVTLARRPSIAELFLYLRIFDAGATRAADLIPHLYPQYCQSPGVPSPDAHITAASVVSRNRKKARELVESEYLCLVPC